MTETLRAQKEAPINYFVKMFQNLFFEQGYKPIDEPQNLGAIKGTKAGSIKIGKNTGLEALVLNGQTFILMKNTEKKDEELDFVLYDAAKTDIVVKDQIYSPEAAELFIPKPYFVGDKKQTVVTLSPFDAFRCLEKPSPVQNRLVTRQTLPYEPELQTITINGNQYFIPSCSQTSENPIGTCFIEAGKASKIVHPDGKISLKSENGIYSAVKVLYEEYNGRKKAAPKINETPQIPLGTVESTR